MISPEFTDTESFVSTLKILADLMPSMGEPARRRAAWQVAKCRASLADACAVEGFSLDGTTAPLAAVRKPAPPVALTASQIAELATLKADIRALGGPPAPPQAAAPAATERKPMTTSGAAHLRLAAALMERAGAEGRATPQAVAAFKQLAADAAAETVENVNTAARAAMERNPRLTYFNAVKETSK